MFGQTSVTSDRSQLVSGTIFKKGAGFAKLGEIIQQHKAIVLLDNWNYFAN